jgi:hypothetical protein
MSIMPIILYLDAFVQTSCLLDVNQDISCRYKTDAHYLLREFNDYLHANHQQKLSAQAFNKLLIDRFGIEKSILSGRNVLLGITLSNDVQLHDCRPKLKFRNDAERRSALKGYHRKRYRTYGVTPRNTTSVMTPLDKIRVDTVSPLTTFQWPVNVDYVSFQTSPTDTEHPSLL